MMAVAGVVGVVQWGGFLILNECNNIAVQVALFNNECMPTTRSARHPTRAPIIFKTVFKIVSLSIR
jgi:hypothetical protein